MIKTKKLTKIFCVLLAIAMLLLLTYRSNQGVVLANNEPEKAQTQPSKILINLPDNNIDQSVSITDDFELEISAEGKAEVMPDSCKIYASIKCIDTIHDVANNCALTMYDNIVAVLTVNGIDRDSIKTDDIYTYESYDCRGSYISNIYFTIDLNNLEDIHTVVALLDRDYVSINDISLTTSQYDYVYAMAVKNAIAKSYQKASTITGQNMQLQEVCESYNYGCFYCSISYNPSTISYDISAPLTITANITATYTIAK